MNEKTKQRIIKHGNNLNKIFGLNKDPVDICRAVRRLEREGDKIALEGCNVGTSPALEKREQQLMIKVDKLLGFKKKKIPVFLNGDPRGYALKIQDDYVRKHDLQIHTDWGGYGIIAPDLTTDQ